MDNNQTNEYTNGGTVPESGGNVNAGGGPGGAWDAQAGRKAAEWDSAASAAASNWDASAGTAAANWNAESAAKLSDTQPAGQPAQAMGQPAQAMGQPAASDATPAIAQTSQAAARLEWERRQREIQDREWQSRQQQYNQQLVAGRSDVVPTQVADGGYPQADWRQQPQQPAGQAQPQYRQPEPYAQSPRDEGQQYQQQADRQYFDYAAYQEHVARPAQPIAGRARQAAGRAPDDKSSDDKKSKRRTRFQILAAGLAGALVTAAIFSAGFFAGNFNRAPVQSADVAAATTSPTTAAQQEQQQAEPTTAAQQPAAQQPSQSQDSGAQDAPGRSSFFPGWPAAGGDSDSADAQDEQVPAGAASPAEFSALTLNPPSGSDLSVTEIYEKNYPSIVGIRITVPMEGYRFGGMMMPGQEQSGEGSGIIVREDGYIMTNQHVIAETIDVGTGKQVEGTRIEVVLPDEADSIYAATIVGYDVSTDLAVLKIEKTGLKAAELGDADQIKVGEFVVAIGNPGGMEYMSSVSFGVVSGLNRSIQTEGYEDTQLIQTDAAINPGNSGGALVNTKGQVIGVNSIKIASSSFEGLGFAIPINTAVEICDDLINYTYVTGRPFIGITANNQYTENLAEQYDMPKGVYVYGVEESGPADGRLMLNDIIVKFNGVDVPNFDALETEKNKCKPGDEITLQVYRGWNANELTSGQFVDVELTLGERRN